MNIGEWLKDARLSSNLTTNDVASSLGISVRHVQYIERDERRPSFEVLQELCRLYSIKNIPMLD